MPTSRRLILSPLLLAVVALAGVLGVATSSAAAGPGPETRVRANATVTADAVGQRSGETAGGVGCLRPAQPDFVSAPCVATNYAGGRHADLDAPPGIQRHHMPADSASPLSTGKGPSIQMDTVDHRQTASWGRSQAAQDYRAQQADLIGQGRFDDAVQMDIDDVIARWPGKYDHAILRMIDSL